MAHRLALLEQHVERFNACVATGDFAPMLAHFSADAVLTFEGVPVGPFAGRDAIAAAYAAQPPDDTISVANPRIVGELAVCDYTWAGEEGRPRSGEMRLGSRDGAITGLTVTFDPQG